MWNAANSKIASSKAAGAERDAKLAEAAQDEERSAKHLSTLRSQESSGSTENLCPALGELGSRAKRLGEEAAAAALAGRSLSLGVDLAQGQPAQASSAKSDERRAACAVDGNPDTRWTSAYADNQWLSIDLGSIHQLWRVDIRWEAAHAKYYTIEGSDDGQVWQTLAQENGSEGWVFTSLLPGSSARWVRMHGQTRATNFGFSIWDLRVLSRSQKQSESQGSVTGLTDLDDEEEEEEEGLFADCPAPAGLTEELWKGVLGGMHAMAVTISATLPESEEQTGHLLQTDWERAWHAWVGGPDPSASARQRQPQEPALDKFALSGARVPEVLDKFNLSGGHGLDKFAFMMGAHAPNLGAHRREEAKPAKQKAPDVFAAAPPQGSNPWPKRAKQNLDRFNLAPPRPDEAKPVSAQSARAEELMRRGHDHWAAEQHAAALKDFTEAELLAGDTHSEGTSPSLLALRYCLCEELDCGAASTHELRDLLSQFAARQREANDAQVKRFFFPREADPVPAGKAPMFSGMQVFDGKRKIPSTPSYPSAEIGYRLFVNREVEASRAPLFVYHHGNGETALDYTNFAGLYKELPCSMIVFDYRGYGWSTGQPAAGSLNPDAEECVRQLPDLLHSHGLSWPWPSPVILVGRSMGGPVAANLACKFPDVFKGLILESAPATSKEENWRNFRMLAGTAGVELAVKLERARGAVQASLPDECRLAEQLLSPLGTCEMLAGFRGHLLVLHGSLDSLIPPSHAERHFESAGQACDRKYVVIEADHNTCGADKNFWRSQREFVKRILAQWHSKKV